VNLIKNLAEHLEGDKAIDHAELTKFNTKLENIRLAACALADLLQRLNSPARGDAAQIEWMFKELDALSGMRDTPESPMPLTMLRTMVSREQLEEKYPKHTHDIRGDVKPYGQCPSCDQYWENRKLVLGKDPSTHPINFNYAEMEQRVAAEKYPPSHPPESHCNFCWKPTGTKDGDCVDCGFSKVPLDVKKWIGGDGKDD
jgi:hypothetical protein